MRLNKLHTCIASAGTIALLGVFVFVFQTRCLAQEGKLIELVGATLMRGSGKDIREWIGKVHFIQTSDKGEKVNLWCDSAVQYLKENRLELFGHVRILRDTTTITADRGRYFGNDRRAEVSSNVRLVRGTTTLTSLYGQHFLEEKRSYFSGNVVLVDTSSSITSNELTFIEPESKSIAVGNVKILNSANSTTIFGDSLVHFDSTRYSIVLKNPKLIQIDTSSSGKIDTLLVVSKIMESYQDSTERFIASDSVAMARGELSSRSGRTTFYPKKDLIILQRQPIVWQSLNQITGDSIVVRLLNKKLHTVYVRGHAVAISRSDVRYHDRYDQLTGRELTMYFANDQLEKVFVDKNATSLYHLYDNDKPNGANKSSGDNITMSFLEGKIDQIKIVGGVEGQYYPEKMLSKRDSQYNLDGFKWYTIRPLRKNLTIVNGVYD